MQAERLSKMLSDICATSSLKADISVKGYNAYWNCLASYGNRTAIVCCIDQIGYEVSFKTDTVVEAKRMTEQ
jgi:hypothetical protein